MRFHYIRWPTRGCFFGVVPNKHSAEEVSRSPLNRSLRWRQRSQLSY